MRWASERRIRWLRSAQVARFLGRNTQQFPEYVSFWSQSCSMGSWYDISLRCSKFRFPIDRLIFANNRVRPYERSHNLYQLNNCLLKLHGENKEVISISDLKGVSIIQIKMTGNRQIDSSRRSLWRCNKTIFFYSRCCFPTACWWRIWSWW